LSTLGTGPRAGAPGPGPHGCRRPFDAGRPSREVNDATESRLHADRYRSTDGDVGADAVVEAARAVLPPAATIYGVTLPRNGRGVYQVGAEILDEPPGDEPVAGSETAPTDGTEPAEDEAAAEAAEAEPPATYSGATLYDGTPEEGNSFDQAWDDWSFPVHTGDFGGTTSRVLWVALGLSPLLLGATGLVMNRVRQGKRAQAARRRAS
jgi:uncharacterized iron-regulated membrane protein